MVKIYKYYSKSSFLEQSKHEFITKIMSPHNLNKPKNYVSPITITNHVLLYIRFQQLHTTNDL